MVDKNNKPKVFCIGWHKTGTTTMGEALLLLGYKVVGARLDLAEQLLKGNTQHAINLAKDYEAFQDVPWAALFKDLDQAYPNSKFILTIREEQKWLQSARKHFGEQYSAMRKWLYGEGVLIGNEERYLERYRRHNQDVQAYFQNRKDDLLIMSWQAGDGWEKLCAYLELPIPENSFPHANKGKHSYTTREKFFRSLSALIPKPLRKKILELLGLSVKRNRFNNYRENRENL
jgi:hypothetical protein